MAIDWLLWDAPWLEGQPAASWLIESSFLARGQTSRRTMRAIIDSRLGLYRLEGVREGEGLLLRDTLTGFRRFVRTPETPWDDPDRGLLARVYRFADSQLVGGEAILLEPCVAAQLVESIRTTGEAQRAPSWPDRRWYTWLKSWLLPLAARQWIFLHAATADLPALGAGWLPRSWIGIIAEGRITQR